MDKIVALYLVFIAEENGRGLLKKALCEIFWIVCDKFVWVGLTESHRVTSCDDEYIWF